MLIPSRSKRLKNLSFQKLLRLINVWKYRKRLQLSLCINRSNRKKKAELPSGESSYRNRNNFQKMSHNLDPHSEICPRDNPGEREERTNKGDEQSEKPKAEPSSALNRNPHWRHVSSLKHTIHFVFSPHPPPPIPSTRFIPTRNSALSKRARRRGTNPKGRGGWLRVHRRWIYTPFNPV